MPRRASRARLRAFTAWARPPAAALPARRLARSDACGPLVLIGRAGLRGTGACAFDGSGRGRGRLADLAAITFRLRAGAPARHTSRGRRRCDLGLAIGADRPRSVERARAANATLAQFAQTAGAPYVVALDRVLAMRALSRLELSQARLRGLCLDLALVHVFEVLGRAHDHVDDRAHEREQRGRDRAADQHRVGDPAARV